MASASSGYPTNASYADTIALVQGQDPVAVSAPSDDSRALYLTEPGDTSAISPFDIAQNQLGDCFMLAALGEIAIVDPSFIADDLIHRNGDGTEEVDLYRAAKGNTINVYSTFFAEDPIHVVNAFPTDSVSYDDPADIVGGKQEIWPAVVENAYAQNVGGYVALNKGGYDPLAMETLTGHFAFDAPTTALSLQKLETLASTPGALLTFDTPNTRGLPDKLVPDHAYMFGGLVQKGGDTLVQLLNPWGVDEPSLIPFSHLKDVTQVFTHGRV